MSIRLIWNAVPSANRFAPSFSNTTLSFPHGVLLSSPQVEKLLDPCMLNDIMLTTMTIIGFGSSRERNFLRCFLGGQIMMIVLMNAWRRMRWHRRMIIRIELQLTNQVCNAVKTCDIKKLNLPPKYYSDNSSVPHSLNISSDVDILVYSGAKKFTHYYAICKYHHRGKV